MTLRQEARVLAVQVLYSLEVSEGYSLTCVHQLCELLGKNLDETAIKFAEILVKGVASQQDEIDALLARHLKNWTINRLSRVDLSILRLSIYSLLYQGDIDAKVVIDEAIKVAKKLSSEKSYGFINGVLHAVCLTVRGTQE